MPAKKHASKRSFVDPDNAPAWTAEQFGRAEVAFGGKVVRPAQGTLITAQRAEEPLPSGNLDQQHYCALRRHLYQDVYDWAGELRTVRTSKGGNMFCYPENIAAQLKKLFDELAAARQFRELDADGFAGAAAHVLAE